MRYTAWFDPRIPASANPGRFRGTVYPTEYHPEGQKASSPYLQPVYTFEANTTADAGSQFRHMALNGIPPSQYECKVVPNPKKLWRFRGAPNHVGRVAREMALPDSFMIKMNKCPRIQDLNTLVAQTCERYHNIRMSRADCIEFSTQDKAVVGSTLKHGEDSISMLHCLAKASVDIADEAYKAFGIDLPERNFSVTIGPPAVTTVTETVYVEMNEAEKAELETLRKEVARLNEELDAATQPATPSPKPKQNPKHPTNLAGAR
jgi:hypothetical protein